MHEGIYIHYVTDNYKESIVNNLPVNIHTHGMEKYGLLNICTAVPYSEKVASRIMNDVSAVMIDEKDTFSFSSNILHYLDMPDGKGGWTEPYFYFRIEKVKCCNDECWFVIETNSEGIPLYPNLFPPTDSIKLL